MFTIIADDVTDCSNKEQLSLTLRFVDRDSNKFEKISSRLLSVTLVVSGRYIADKMLKILQV